MLLGFKTELKVNKQQRLLLEQHAGVATQAWNQGLALCQQVLIDNKLNPQDKIKFPTAIDLHKWLVAAVKSCHPWYYQVSKCTPQYELRYLSEANIRKDTLHKITTCISKNHAVIGIEDLNVSGMLANGKLSKAIADMGFDQFRRQLEYKTQLYGSKLVVVDRFYPGSKTCSDCGEKKSQLPLSQRVFKCGKCGFECGRDLNAATNLKKKKWSVSLSNCG